MIVRALVRKPKLMLLDEADTHMTPVARSHFIKLLQELRQDGVGVIITSRSKEVHLMATRRIILSEGRMVTGDLKKEVELQMSRLLTGNDEDQLALRVASAQRPLDPSRSLNAHTYHA